MRWAPPVTRLGPAILLSCGHPGDVPPDPPPFRAPAGVWDPRLPDAETLGSPRGLVARRAVFHLHSPWSHDACDGDGFVEGVYDGDCEADLRRALCDTRYDLAFLTDHPDHASARPFADLFPDEAVSTWLREGDEPVAAELTCDDGHTVRWRAGFEDELMPVGLARHVDDDPAVRHALLNADDDEALRALTDAGARVFVAHTEGRDDATLARQQDAGLHGVEVFNVHAMFAPDIRREHLGLDPLGWITDIGPFTLPDATAPPDLLFLAVHQRQDVSLARFDALLARGPMMGVAGSDAHQNVLPTVLSDGERVDSYRRTLRWFSTLLLARGDAPADDLEALDARRAYVAFEALGTPYGLDVHLEAKDGTVHELGADAPPGDLVVTCPTLHPLSPHDGPDPQVAVRVLRDGAVWKEECGRWPVEPGVYRVEIDLVPHHLAGFLPAEGGWIRPYPWVVTNAIRVR